MLALLVESLQTIAEPSHPITVVHVETGVDIPLISRFVRKTLAGFRKFSNENKLPLKIRTLRPPINDRFFVKVIGRGYPPPTNKFRWCTDRLRINPVKRYMQSIESNEYTIMLGTRLGESAERDRTLASHRIDKYTFAQNGQSGATVFCPIIDFSTQDVWSTLRSSVVAEMINAEKLLSIYKDASVECPIVRDAHGTPCGQGRFGCWTCTVVRQDKAVTGLVQNGQRKLKPMLQFRNWLACMRDDPKNRCSVRRNGESGLGPLTLEARKQILRRLRSVEKRTPYRLIDEKEIEQIKHLWKADRVSENYREC